MVDNYEIAYVRRTKPHIMKYYLDFLIKNGTETEHYYKYMMKKTRKLFVYKNTQKQTIDGIIGIRDDIEIVKFVHTPMWCNTEIYFTYCSNDSLFRSMLDDLRIYALRNQHVRISFHHMTQYHDIFIEFGYDAACDSDYDNCEYCFMFLGKDKYHRYFKDISDINTVRKVYHKQYDPKYNFADYICYLGL
jgi:hypothetical protein